MCPGQTADLKQIDDARKTAVIDKEFLWLNVDVACLQDTRLADRSTIREANYTFFWQGKSLDEPQLHGVGLQLRTRFSFS